MFKIEIGDRVSHNVFPPVEGIVTGGYMVGNSLKISVMRDDNTVYQDFYNTWDLVNTCNRNTENVDDSDIIDAEFVVIE